MKVITYPSMLLLALCSLPALADDHATEAEAPAAEAQLEVVEEGAKKCDRKNYRECITNECSTGPGGVTDQCRNFCKQQTGC